ncbi:hypothetical protein [Tissierella sp.]|uniref:hypothetical protein n=1 Tax=Tissierella sp. TaxID=41274 RepID=UPI0028586CA6|nr:hypothetical protein [Tissierella sp.]MDR7856041.1 hypothetical protein [Tissierella sp.]
MNTKLKPKVKEWTFEEDSYILTKKNINLMAKKLDRISSTVIKRLEYLKKNEIDEEQLKRHKRFIQEAYHYMSATKIAIYLEVPYQYVHKRIKTLLTQNDLEKTYFSYTSEEEKYLLENRDKLTVMDFSRDLKLSEAQIFIWLTRIKTKEEKDKPKEETIEPMPKEMEIVIPENALLVSKVKGPSNLIEGKMYEIKILRSNNEKTDSYFVGTFIEETDNHITFQSKSGYRESFSKVNFSIGEYKIREVD